MTDEVKAAVTEVEANAPPSITERARALVESYSHALTTNSPRTVAELEELQALLFHSDGG